MPPKVTYWTGTWDPAKEAISKEICELRRGHRERAPVVAFSPSQPFRYSPRDRVLQIPARAWPVLRAAAAAIERSGDITHIFGGSVSWHLIRALGRKPIVLTAAVANDGDVQLPHSNISRVIVETDLAVDEWVQAGIKRDHVSIVRPGIDLDHFNLHEPPQGPFTLIFASTPSDVSEIASRGIPLLVELARARPDIRIILPWRQWGDVTKSREALVSLRPPGNFIVTHDNVHDMREVYRLAHATIVIFAAGTGKAVPNFVIEGLAMGLPCIATKSSGLASDLAQHRAGLVVEPQIAALSNAVDELQADSNGYSRRARLLAEARYDLRTFVAAYDRIYDEVGVTSSGRPTST
jgi:glycosyltransferase involved in cell wall biosynthesis